MKHLLKLGGMTPEEILHILDVADEYKRLHKDGVDPKNLQGKAGFPEICGDIMLALPESSEPKPSSMNSVSMTTPPAFCWIVSLMPSARLSAAMKLSPPDRLPTGRVLPV